MDFYAIPGNFVESAAEALAVAVFKDEKPTSGVLKDLDKASGGQVAAVIKSGEFKGDSGETALVRLSPKGKMKASRLLLVGVGEKKEFKAYDVGVAAGSDASAGNVQGGREGHLGKPEALGELGRNE